MLNTFLSILSWLIMVQLNLANQKDQWELPVMNSKYVADVYFYIYDGPDWDYIATAGMRVRDVDEIVNASFNYGAGPVVDSSNGAYHTDQYQLYALHYHRWLKDARRTFDPAKATTFIIPYDLATDAAYYKHCAKNKDNKCFDFRKCPLAPQVESLLQSSQWYQRKSGKDHLLVVGMNYAMDHYIMKPKCKSLLLNACKLCTKIAIDDYSYLHSGSIGINEKGDNWHAVPFPGNYHYHKEVTRPFPWEREDINRSILVSYIGSTQSYYNPARRLRGSLAHFCRQHPNDCVHSTYGATKDNQRSVFYQEGHNPLQLSQRSIFCFQPIGDLMTRKGLFDSLFQGCIPVTFDDLTASVMYTWHWPETLWREIEVSLAFHPVAHRYMDPIEELRKLVANNRSLVEKKQRLIREKVFELQYGLDNVHEEVFRKVTSGGMEWYSSWPKTPDTLEPMRDAYDITMDHVLSWHSGKEVDFRDATVPECWNGFLNKSANNGKGRCDVEKNA
jgi:hypothetical protein